MASSGISPFGTFTKLVRYSILPYMMKESRNIVGQVHILGEDPLTAMEKRANSSASHQYRDLLLGYIATVRNGGDIASYLQSKMKSIFEYEVSIAKQSVAKIGGLVDAYMMMLVIAMSMYVIIIAMSSISSASNLVPAAMTSPAFSYMTIFIVMPAISIMLLYALDKTIRSPPLIGSKSDLMTGIYFTGVAIGAFAALTVTGIINKIIDPMYAFPLFLLLSSVKPAYTSIKIERGITAVESEVPGYLRDVAEARKAGLSPEKCIIYASERLRNAKFQQIVKAFSNQLEWGVPLHKIYENLSMSIKSWSALIHFRILIEAIESGGGYTTSLEILAQSSESFYNTEREKKSLLRPYFIIALMVCALTSVSTLMVAQTFLQINGSFSGSGGDGTNGVNAFSPTQDISGPFNPIQIFSMGISIQSWMTGLLIGKITSGSFATGFKYSVLLLAISFSAIVITQEFHISPSILFNHK